MRPDQSIAAVIVEPAADNAAILLYGSSSFATTGDRSALPEEPAMPFLSRQATVDSASSNLGARADRLVQELVGTSKSFVAGLFDHDCVKLNTLLLPDAGYRLKAGDRIDVRYEANRRYSPKPRQRPTRGFEIVYEDREVIVVNKDADLLTVPTEHEEPYTLIDRVNEYVEREGKGRDRGAFIVHRLDRGVSGLLVFGKSKIMADRLRDQFAARKPERLYTAIVNGKMKQTQGEFRSYLATAKSLNRYSTNDPQDGELAVTHYQVLEFLADTTLVEVQLETGRRNQIRVHFAEAGHPVLGDPRYNPDEAQHAHWPHERIALHARTLGIANPETGAAMKFELPLPSEMTRFIEQGRPRFNKRR